MTDKLTVNRRRVLELTGVGTGVAVAGCTNQLGGEGDSRQVTVSLQPDQEAIQARQQELREELIAGNTTRQEAQQELQALQEEAIADAVDTAEDEFESSGITIEDRIEDQGLFLISGSAADLLDSLELDVVQAIAAGGLFEQAQAAQQQQPSPDDDPDAENDSTA